MKAKIFSGVIPALMTPCKDDRTPDFDQLVRKAYDDFDFKRITRALTDFANVELSAFYFDIRKDALYCDAAAAPRRRAARTVLDALFARLVAWLAPILPFTMEEVWLERHPGDDASVHLVDFPATPSAYNMTLDAKWLSMYFAAHPEREPAYIFCADGAYGVSNDISLQGAEQYEADAAYEMEQVSTGTIFIKKSN